MFVNVYAEQFGGLFITVIANSLKYSFTNMKIVCFAFRDIYFVKECDLYNVVSSAKDNILP